VLPTPRGTGRGRDLRRAPRVDVLTRVKGQLVPIDTPVTILNLSRMGFAIVSDVAFQPGQLLDFRLTAENGVVVTVTAEAVHSRPHPRARGQHLTGFRFVPGRLTGIVPQAKIDQLIDAVVPVGSLI